MSSYAEKLTKTAASELSGEQFTAAMKCFPLGHSKRKMKGSVFGVVGALVAQSGTKEGHTIGDQALPRELAIGLTPTRAFVFALGSMTGKAQLPPLRVVPRDQIVGIASGSARTLHIKQTHIWVRMADGNQLELETAQGHADGGQAVVDELRTTGVPTIPPPDDASSE